MNSKVIRFLLIIFLGISSNIFSANKKSVSKTSKMDKTMNNSSLKIAYVNLNKILTFDSALLPTSSKEWQKNYISLQESLSPIEVELKALEEKFEKGRNEFESLQKSGLASNEALQQKYEELAKLELELRKRLQEREQFAQEEIKKIQLKISPKIEKAIREIKIADNYNLVLRSEFVIDADQDMDITSQVLDIMNKQYTQENKEQESKEQNKEQNKKEELEKEENK